MLLPYLPRGFSTDVQALLALGGYGAAPWVTEPVFYLSIGAGKLIASLGLILFLSWGRWLFLAIVVTSLASVPFAGIAIAPPLDSVVGYFTVLTDGAILALAFSSPIAERWRKDA